MEIRQFKHFIEIAKWGSFSQAAEKCYITVQGISMSINRLEEELGVRLFERNAKRVVLTKSGEYLYPFATQVVKTIDDCKKHFEDERLSKMELTAMFALGTIEEFAGNPIGEFMRTYPEIRLDIREGQDAQCDDAVESGAVELALCVGPIDETKFDSVLLQRGQNVLIVNEKWPLAEYEKISINELKKVPMALQRRTTRSTETLISLCEKSGFTPNVKTYVNDIMLSFYLAGLGQCCGISTYSLAKRLNRPHLRIIPFEEEEMQWNIYRIIKKGERLSPEMQVFDNIIKRHSQISDEA